MRSARSAGFHPQVEPVRSISRENVALVSRSAAATSNQCPW
jgi:hypothetical protein